MRKARPYRSRKIPACSRCRARRSKCTIKTIGEACHLCEKDGTTCSAKVNTSAPKKYNVAEPASGDGHVIDTQATTDLHIVPPMIARDTKVLEDYFPTGDVSTTLSTTQRVKRQEPVYHISIPPRRASPEHCDCSQDLPLKLVDTVRPFLNELVKLYLDRLHPCLPIFDRKSLDSYLASKSPLSLTFLVTFEAYTMFHWTLTPSLKPHLKPDQDFAWQAVCTSMDSNLSKGGLLAIICAILSVAGRPSKGVVHNMTNVARMVALSHSIGLNHDCSDWQISEAEKRMRWRVWWAVLIHDTWFHFAQGTPPLINPAQHNVPIPSIELLSDPEDPFSEDSSEMRSQDRAFSARCYIALCQLTEIVADILPLVYHVRSGTLNSVNEQLADLHERVKAWSFNRPAYLDLDCFEDRVLVSGWANLQLAYFATQMLLQRLFWHEASLSQIDRSELLLSECQFAAEMIVEFITSLKSIELRSFWLPYSAQHFTSAVSLLLRCALKTGDEQVRRKCVDAARTIVSTLQKFRGEHDWDMAETALNQSKMILNRVEEALPNLYRVEVFQGTNPSLSQQERTTETDQPIPPANDWYHPLDASSLEDLFPEAFSVFGDFSLFDHVWSHAEASD